MRLGDYLVEVKVGDSVVHTHYGKGTVEEIRPEEKYPIEMYFPKHGSKGKYTRFTPDGREVGKSGTQNIQFWNCRKYPLDRLKEKRFKLTHEALTGLMQGKKVQFRSVDSVREEEIITILSPVDGIFLTNDQIFELQNQAMVDVMGLINRMGDS